MLFFLLLTLFVAGYFAFRYITLIFALRQVAADLQEIRRDVHQNQLLQLPIPNRHLQRLLNAFQSTMDEMRVEYRRYENREKELKQQIENISHDLRTPLTAILGYVKLYQRAENYTLEENEELAETLAVIQRKAERMKELTAQFYDYSRLDAGDYELRREPVDVSRILRESMLEQALIWEQAQLKVEAELPEHPVRATGDAVALERIFQNLFQNVGRYADTFFHLTLREEEKNIVISFINDTRRLSASDLPHLFERFYRQDASRGQEGSGLGLTVARLLAEKMGATLCVREIPQNEKYHPLVICFEMRITKE